MLYRQPLESNIPEDIICLCECCHALWHSFYDSSVVKSREFTLGFLEGVKLAADEIIIGIPEPLEASS